MLVPSKPCCQTVFSASCRTSSGSNSLFLMPLTRPFGLIWQVSPDLCLPQIKPEHIGDAVHPGSNGRECAPLPRRPVISARPCSTISEYACHCSSPCRTAAHGADGVHYVDRTVPEDARKVRGKGHLKSVRVRPMLLAASDRIPDANDIRADHLPQDVLAPPSQSDDGRVFRANSRHRRTHP